MVKPRTAIRLLTKMTHMDGSTLFFHTSGLGRRSGNSRDTFIKTEHVPDFEGHEAWFELEHVTAKPWCYWRAIRQVPPPPDWEPTPPPRKRSSSELLGHR